MANYFLGLLFLVLSLFPLANLSFASVPIIGGEKVAESDAIAHRTVGLFLQEKNGQRALCSGSILDSTHILTAAHCVENVVSGFVIFSAIDVMKIIRHRTDSESAPFLGAITSVRMYPGYEENSDLPLGEFVDIGIITFSGGLPTNYEAAHFLPHAKLLTELTHHKPITLAGYGVNDATPDPGDNGSGELRKVGVRLEEVGEMKEDIEVENDEQIACHGDSGGPALIEDGNDVYVIGVASRSDCHESSIYTLVDQEFLKQ